MAGTISLGLFAAGVYGAPTATGADTSSVVTGLFYGGGVSQLWTQFYGTTVVALAVFAVSMVLMYAVKATGTLRVSPAGETGGAWTCTSTVPRPTPSSSRHSGGGWLSSQSRRRTGRPYRPSSLGSAGPTLRAFTEVELDGLDLAEVGTPGYALDAERYRTPAPTDSAATVGGSPIEPVIDFFT